MLNRLTRKPNREVIVKCFTIDVFMDEKHILEIVKNGETQTTKFKRITSKDVGFVGIKGLPQINL